MLYYKNAQKLVEEHVDELAEFKINADMCPFCGGFYLAFVEMEKVDETTFKSFRRKWAKPSLWYVLVNIFNYFIRNKYVWLENKVYTKEVKDE